MERPRPPKHLWEPEALGTFEPAPQVVEWIHATFLNEKSPLYDVSHAHLLEANIGVLWTDVVNESKMVQVLGTACMPRPPMGGKWSRAKWELQQRQFFGLNAHALDFEITLYAPYSAQCSDVGFCSVIKHEISHCAQALDEYEQPRYTGKEQRPVFCLKDHDFAGFLGNVRDFGAGAERNVPELIKLVEAGPRIAAADIAGVCGHCHLRLA